jgi:hypothetical protein
MSATASAAVCAIEAPLRLDHDAKATRSIQIADSMIIFEKGRRIRKHAERRGQPEPNSNLLGELSFDE